MTLDLRRGIKFGALSAICFAFVISLNQLARSETLRSSEIVVGAIFAFCVFAVVGSLTDKVGSDFGDA